MRHEDSQALFQYWNTKRGERSAPARADIEPADIRKLLPQVFIGETTFEDDIVFRLAGTGLCALAGQELKMRRIADLWLPEGRRTTSRAFFSATIKATPLVISADMLTKGGRVCQIEIIAMPLQGPTARHDRLLGMLSVFDPPFWIGHDHLSGLSTRGLRFLDTARDPLFLANRPEVTLPDSPHLAAAQNRTRRERKVGHLIVLEGGRQD